MNPRHLAIAACLAAPLLAAAPAQEILPPAEPKRSGGVLRWLLPKAFQKNPDVEFNILTEMTAEGKRFPKPSPRQPIYYVEQPGKFTQMGTQPPAGERAPPIPELERAMQSALAAGGYVAAAPGGPPPRLFVVFNFGSFARFSTDAEEAEAEAIAIQAYNNAVDEAARANPPRPPPDPPDSALFSPDTADQLLSYVLASPEKQREVIERATLIAGTKFAQDLGKVLTREIDYRKSRAGYGPAESDLGSPFNVFRNRNPKLVHFVEESFSSCYFVIASGYDYAEVSRGNRVLLWRTKMTVNSLGISMVESLPALIASAGPYLGRDMSEPATLSHRISREGRVHIGTATVVEDTVSVPPKAPPAKDAPPAAKAAPGQNPVPANP